MSAKVYSKSAKGAEHALRATGENRLYLTDAEENTLRKALDEQCDNHNIKGLKLKLIQTVFRQTIGFNKREDDLTGVRLQKLVGSRRDYCNKYVTEMIDQSILIFRRGYYGRILSINYNFDDWGKAPEDVKTKRSEPEKYLQNHKPQEQCQSKVENHILNAIEDPSLSTVKAHFMNEVEGDFLKHILPDDITRLITQDMLNQLADTLMSSIKTILEQLTPQILLQLTGLETQIAPQATSEKCPRSSLKTIPEAQIAPQATPETCPESRPKTIPEAPIDTPTSPANDAENHQKSEKIPAPKTEKTQSEPVETNPQDQHSSDKETDQSIDTDYDDLIFPEQLKPYEQNQIKTILSKTALDKPQSAQLVLNSMASRFALDMPPIKSPIAYFRSLLKKSQSGALETSYADNFIRQQQETQKQAKQNEDTQTRKTQIKKYNEAKNNYERVLLMAEHSDKSAWQFAKDLGWLNLLEEMGFDLG